MGLLRVSAEIEAAGMDVSKHGGAAYEGAAAAPGRAQSASTAPSAACSCFC